MHSGANRPKGLCPGTRKQALDRQSQVEDQNLDDKYFMASTEWNLLNTLPLSVPEPASERAGSYSEAVARFRSSWKVATSVLLRNVLTSSK